MNLNEIKNSYLTFIRIHLETLNPDNALIRTFIDKWFAYSMKGNFLTIGNRERWFNKPFANKLSSATKDCLLKMHFISRDALSAIKSESEIRLVKDHSVPVKIITNLLKEKQFRSEEEIEQLLIKYYSLGVLTAKEDKLLNQSKLKADMPSDWNRDNVFARYKKVGIERASL
jgi:hypothetical protein